MAWDWLRGQSSTPSSATARRQSSFQDTLGRFIESSLNQLPLAQDQLSGLTSSRFDAFSKIICPAAVVAASIFAPEYTDTATRISNIASGLTASSHLFKSIGADGSIGFKSEFQAGAGELLRIGGRTFCASVFGLMNPVLGQGVASGLELAQNLLVPSDWSQPRLFDEASDGSGDRDGRGHHSALPTGSVISAGQADTDASRVDAWHSASSEPQVEGVTVPASTPLAAQQAASKKA